MGLQKALQMMLTSAPISAKDAQKAGLFDAVVPAAELLPTARALALDMAEGRSFRKVTIDYTAKLESLAEAEAIFEFARAEAIKKAGAAPVLLSCSYLATSFLARLRSDTSPSSSHILSLST